MLNEKGERMLAYIVEVDKVTPLEGYDRVELATVGGWHCVVEKGDFDPNDEAKKRGIYFEIDSKVPDNDERFAFMAKRNFKVKTQRMCKVISQGLLMPLSAFPEFKDLPLHSDVGQKLGVTYISQDDNIRKANKAKDIKYMSMAARHKNIIKKKPFRWLMKREWGRKLLFVFLGKKKDSPKAFPTHFPYIHKTDEERVENIPFILNNEDDWIVTEKLDGTSSTYILERKKKRRNKFEFYVLSRNIRQKDEKQNCYHDHNIYWDMAFKYHIREQLETYLKQNPELDYVCVQGESVGSVQGNPLKLKEDDLYIFNFIRSDRGRVPSTEAQLVVNEMGMKFVPILDAHYKLPKDLDEFKKVATAKSVVNPSVYREGIVLRNPKTDFSFKNVSREYLLKHHD